MTYHRKLSLFSSVLIIIGLIGIVPTLYYWSRNYVSAYQIQITEPATIISKSPSVVTGKPVRITINSLNLQLQVADGTYDNKSGQWTLSKTMAHFALLTVQPNNAQGNTLIYGHATSEVFGPLDNLTPGDEAIIATDNGYEFTYVYRSTRTVDPTDTNIFAYQGVPILTLQTCSGTWSQNRQFYGFDFVRFKKI